MSDNDSPRRRLGMELDDELYRQSLQPHAVASRKKAVEQDLDEEMVAAIERLKERQNAGELKTCPRCGKMTMLPDWEANPVSRYVDVRICPDCELNEADLDVMNSPKWLKEWDALPPYIPQGSFMEMDADDAERFIRRTQGPRICELYLKREQGEAPDDLERAVWESCVGLTDFDREHFHLRYACADDRSVTFYCKLRFPEEVVDLYSFVSAWPEDLADTDI